MPALARSKVTEDARPPAPERRQRPRFGSRYFTRVYVETHVRRQLGAIRERLRLARLDAGQTDDAPRIAALEGELESHEEPLLGWRRLGGLVARLPPVAAALPVLSAASAWPIAGDDVTENLDEAAIVLGATAVAVWVLVVWPSIRLGFRVKRAIFTGGHDLWHPLLDDYRAVTWGGFGTPMPEIGVYAAEDAVYRILARRKPTEFPVDLALGIAPYLACAYSAFYFYAVFGALFGDRGDFPVGPALFGLVLAVVVPGGFVFFGRRSYLRRGR
jgi:hypothetical protein